jgi:MFS family permease
MTSAALRPVSYRHLLGAQWARRLLVADICVRLPQGMATLTVLLVCGSRHSSAVAGAALAGYTLGQAVAAPARGRLSDRRGIYPVAVVCLSGYLVLLLGMAVVARTAGAAPVLVGLAAGAGLFTPPLSAAMRSLWSANAPDAVRHTAFAVDAAIFDLAFIAGPAFSALLVTRVAPAAGVLVMLSLLAVAVQVSRRVPQPERRPALPDSSAVRRLVRGSLSRLLVVAGCANLALTAVEVSLTSLARQQHQLWASGLLLAEVSAGSVIGSLLHGGRGRPFRPAGDRLTTLMGGYAAALLLLALASTQGLLVAAAAPVAGLCLGPTLATLFTAAADAAPAGTATETQAWVNTIMSAGASAGAATAGIFASHPPLAITTAVVAAAAGSLLARRTTRKPLL